MTTCATAVAVAPCDDNYDDFLHELQARFSAVLAAGDNLLFTTNAVGLFDVYLAAIPAQHRQYFTCNCCRQFVERFGGLVTINEYGVKTPAMWRGDFPGIHTQGAFAMHNLVSRAKVTGVFLSSDKRWGHAEAGGFQHMHVTPPAALVFKRTLMTAGQKMAEKREDFRNMARALAEFSPMHVEQALNLLRTDTLYQSAKVIGPAEFLSKLHTDRAAARGAEARDNVLWRAVAAAPAGFCHPRTSMVGTLLEDIAAGMNFSEVSSRFAAKMHPLRYLRPQAAPTAGNIAQAEKAFEQLGLAPALERRIARLDEVPKVWTPRAPAAIKSTGGVFGHLQPKGEAPTPGIQVPAITMTLQKFVQTVIPAAEQIEVELGSYRSNPFIVITTAVHADAPPLFQWPHPFAWYVWNGGAPASQYGLGAGWAKLSGITRLPARWDDDGQRFTHQGDGLILLLDGARESRNTSAAIFPSLLRSELHGVRATLEAFSREGALQGMAEGDAIGYDLRAPGALNAKLRVKTAGHQRVYHIDRWD